MSLFDSPLFDPRHELGVHALCLALALVIVVLSIVRMTDPLPFTRGQIMGLSMGLKTVTFIQYQLVVKHVPPFRKFGSPLGFAILNVSEIFTWPVGVAFQFLGMSQLCVGDSCKLQQAAAALTIVILLVSIQPAISSTLDYMYSRRHNTERGQEHSRELDSGPKMFAGSTEYSASPLGRASLSQV